MIEKGEIITFDHNTSAFHVSIEYIKTYKSHPFLNDSTGVDRIRLATLVEIEEHYMNKFKSE